MRALFVGVVAALLLAPLPLCADTVSERPDKVRVTLYHIDHAPSSEFSGPDAATSYHDQGLAFIVDERALDLPAGPQVIQFRGVPSTMVPQSADVAGLPVPVGEQNFDYDLLSPGALLAKSIGKRVTLVRTDRKTGAETARTAIVRSGPDGAALEIDGKIEALGCSGLPERLVFDTIPEGLSDSATLSLRVTLPAAGRYTIKLSYIATGMLWNADYVGRIAPDGKTLDLSGWITLANFTNTSFAQVPLEVVAGRLNSTGEDVPVEANALSSSTMCWPTQIDWATHRLVALGFARGRTVQDMTNHTPGLLETVIVTAEKRTAIDPRKLGDYKLYPLPEPTTMAALQTKQVQFLDRPGIPFEKLFVSSASASYEQEPEIEAAFVCYRIDNSVEKGLGKPLPAGSWSAEETTADGNPVFLGQGGISDTPVGLPVDVSTGRALDVEVQRSVSDREPVGSRKDGNRQYRSTVTVLVSNAKPMAVPFEFYETSETGRVVSETKPHGINHGRPMWRFMIEAGKTATLEYTVEFTDDY